MATAPGPGDRSGTKHLARIGRRLRCPMLPHSVLLCALLGAGLALAANLAHAAGPPVSIQGSTTFNTELLAGHQKAIEAAAHVTVTVVPNKSDIGLVALMQGQADLAMISTSLENEIGILRRTHPELPLDSLQAFEVAHTHATLIVNPHNSVQSISTADLKHVLTGDITNWRQLGGADHLIRIVAVQDGGGAVASVEAAVLGPGGQITAPRQVRVMNGPQVGRIVEQDEDSIGLTQASSLKNRNVTELATEHPFDQVLYLVSMGPLTPAMRAVIDACGAVAASSGTM